MRLQRLPVIAGLLFSLPALADRGFAPLPAAEPGTRRSGLELRIVRYKGATNGELDVEVRNPRSEPAEFVARGLYFVPQGNADQAPQRLGAVGPFQVKTAQGWQRRERTTIPPGGVAHMKLDVYCIDSHRASPSSSTAFRVAKDRVPKAVADTIDHDAHKAAVAAGGMASPKAKSAVQSQVWKNRDKRWIELDGEGKQEALKK